MTLDLIATEGLSAKKLKLVQGTLTVKLVPPTPSTIPRGDQPGAPGQEAPTQSANADIDADPAEVVANASAVAVTARADADVALAALEVAACELASLDRATPRKDVAITILCASGLAKADFSLTGKGASDPFCEVMWNGRKIHKTKVRCG